MTKFIRIVQIKYNKNARSIIPYQNPKMLYQLNKLKLKIILNKNKINLSQIL